MYSELMNPFVEVMYQCFFPSRVGVKRDGVVKIPGGGRIIFDITLLEVEDGENQKLYQWEPSKSQKWETTQVCAFPSQYRLNRLDSIVSYQKMSLLHCFIGK